MKFKKLCKRIDTTNQNNLCSQVINLIKNYKKKNEKEQKNENIYKQKQKYYRHKVKIFFQSLKLKMLEVSHFSFNYIKEKEEQVEGKLNFSNDIFNLSDYLDF